MNDELAELGRLAESVGVRAHDLLVRAGDDYAAGRSTLKQLDIVTRAVSRLAAKPWRTVYQPLRQLQRKVKIERRKDIKLHDAKALGARAGTCPYCNKPLATMEMLIKHLREHHGWEGTGYKSFHEPKCACGVGKGFTDGDLARHLLRVGDLGVHLVRAALKPKPEPKR